MQKNAAQSALQQIHNMHKEITCTYNDPDFGRGWKIHTNID